MWLTITFILSLHILIPLWMYMGPVYEGDYRGRVVDAETGDPIEGVVVAGIWYKEKINLAGGNSIYTDAKEDLTDKNGQFNIKVKFIKQANVILYISVYKSGYNGLTKRAWRSLAESSGVQIVNENPEIKIHKLTHEKRLKMGTFPIPSSDAYIQGKIPLMIKEINKEMHFLDLELYPEVEK